MPHYRIFYLKDAQLAAFRQAPPGSGTHELKPRHYEEGGEIEAQSPYAVWQTLQGEEVERRGIRKMGVGDALDSGDSGLLVCNFWGFDRAAWHLPHPAQEAGEHPDPSHPQRVPGGGEQPQTERSP